MEYVTNSRFPRYHIIFFKHCQKRNFLRKLFCINQLLSNLIIQKLNFKQFDRHASAKKNLFFSVKHIAVELFVSTEVTLGTRIVESLLLMDFDIIVSLVWLLSSSPILVLYILDFQIFGFER